MWTIWVFRLRATLAHLPWHLPPSRANAICVRLSVRANYRQRMSTTWIAHLYLGNARQGYLRWGADGKVRQLEQLHPRLRQDKGALGPTGTIEASIEQLDLAT